jgi:hypothetical protein
MNSRTKATDKNWIKISRGQFAHVSLCVKVVKVSEVAKPWESQSGWLLVEEGKKSLVFDTKWAAMSFATIDAADCHKTQLAFA